MNSVVKPTRTSLIILGILVVFTVILLDILLGPIKIKTEPPIKIEVKAKEPEIVEVSEEYRSPVDRIMSDMNRVIQKYPHHNNGLADKLYKEVKVLCWVNTWPDNHKTKSKAVKETWGKRCNKLIFMSTKEDPELDTVVLPLQDGRKFLWSKIREAFKYIYKHHFNEYDWFIRADDDT